VVAKAWEQVDRIADRACHDLESALVTGAGPIGLLAAMLGVQRGLDARVLDRVSDGVKPELVRALGATYHSEGVESAGAVDVVIEATGAGQLVVRRRARDRRRRDRVPDRGLTGGALDRG
jgi:threonine dehydrogenase-like Zn-dependent dehydrogenase